MRLVAGWIAVAALSVVIAWGLSMLPEMQHKMTGASGDVTVFRELRPITLSPDNLVDWLMQSPMRLELRKVDWRYRILALDYEVTDEAVIPDDVYLQLTEAVRHGLAGTVNVDRVQIRVFRPAEAEDDKQRLLVALEAKRGQFDAQADEEWRNRPNDPAFAGWLSERYHFTQTSRWKELLSTKRHAK